MQKYFKKVILIITLGILGIFLISLINFPVINADTVSKLFPESKIAAGFLLFGFFCLKSVLVFMPLAFLYVAAAIIFSPAWAIFYSIVFLTVEMTLAFIIGKRLGTKKLIALTGKNEKIMRIVSYIDRYSVISSFVIRFIPGPPADVSSMFLGATNIKYSHFIIGTILGMIPNMIPVILMGEAIRRPFSKEFIIPFLISILFAIIALVLYRLNETRKK